MDEELKKETGAQTRRIDFEYSRSLPAILRHHRLSLLITTYQAGKLVVIGAREDSPDLVISYRNLSSPMGVAIRPETDSLAVAVDTQVWQWGNVPALAGRLDPPGTYDACYLPRRAIFTGPIDAHEMAWCGNDLWIVNTSFSCLCTLDGVHNFVPQWKPAFVTALAAQDRCHLNGLAVLDGRPGYVTALGETDTREGWRAGKASGGCVIDVASGGAVVRGLSMPHSPRVRAGELLLLESGRGRLVRADRARGGVEPLAELPGYARGLAFAGSLAFVGLSKFRSSPTPKATFQNLPISERTTPLSCGVSVVDLGSGREVSRLEFHSGIDEIFDVQPLRNACNPWLSGPHHTADEAPPIWIVPDLKVN
ncbi:MAG: TIGR03032 family protein [Isosphaeraceae bacterium]